MRINISNKKGAIGEFALMIPRLFLVAFIALVVLGMSFFAYDYYLDVKSAEAFLLTKNIVNCLAPDGILNISSLSPESEDHVLDYCKIKTIKKVYVRSEVMAFDASEQRSKIIKTLQQGDSFLKDFRDKFPLDREPTKKLTADEKLLLVGELIDPYNWIIEIPHAVYDAIEGNDNLWVNAGTLELEYFEKVTGTSKNPLQNLRKYKPGKYYMNGYVVRVINNAQISTGLLTVEVAIENEE